MPSLHPNCFWYWTIQTIYWKNTLYRCWTSRACSLHKLDVKLQSYVGVAFLCLLCAFLPSLTTLEWIDQQYFAKQRWGTSLYPQIWMPW